MYTIWSSRVFFLKILYIIKVFIYKKKENKINQFFSKKEIGGSREASQDMPDGMGDPLRYSREAKIFIFFDFRIWVHNFIYLEIYKKLLRF